MNIDKNDSSNVWHTNRFGALRERDYSIDSLYSLDPTSDLQRDSENYIPPRYRKIENLPPINNYRHIPFFNRNSPISAKVESLNSLKKANYYENIFNNSITRRLSRIWQNCRFFSTEGSAKSLNEKKKDFLRELILLESAASKFMHIKPFKAVFTLKNDGFTIYEIEHAIEEVKKIGSCNVSSVVPKTIDLLEKIPDSANPKIIEAALFAASTRFSLGCENTQWLFLEKLEDIITSEETENLFNTLEIEFQNIKNAIDQLSIGQQSENVLLPQIEASRDAIQKVMSQIQTTKSQAKVFFKNKKLLENKMKEINIRAIEKITPADIKKLEKIPDSANPKVIETALFATATKLSLESAATKKTFLSYPQDIITPEETNKLFNTLEMEFQNIENFTHQLSIGQESEKTLLPEIEASRDVIQKVMNQIEAISSKGEIFIKHQNALKRKNNFLRELTLLEKISSDSSSIQDTNTVSNLEQEGYSLKEIENAIQILEKYNPETVRKAGLQAFALVKKISDRANPKIIEAVVYAAKRQFEFTYQSIKDRCLEKDIIPAEDIEILFHTLEIEFQNIENAIDQLSIGQESEETLLPELESSAKVIAPIRWAINAVSHDPLSYKRQDLREYVASIIKDE